MAAYLDHTGEQQECHRTSVEKEELKELRLLARKLGRVTFHDVEIACMNDHAPVTARHVRDRIKDLIADAKKLIKLQPPVRPRQRNKGKARMSRCTAVLCHGPGHQSKTHCQKTDKYHKTHECYFGSHREYAQWKGQKAYTGFFDEPPQEK